MVKVFLAHYDRFLCLSDVFVNDDPVETQHGRIQNKLDIFFEKIIIKKEIIIK